MLVAAAAIGQVLIGWVIWSHALAGIEATATMNTSGVQFLGADGEDGTSGESLLERRFKQYDEFGNGVIDEQGKAVKVDIRLTLC